MRKTHSTKPSGRARSMSFGAALGTAAAVILGAVGFSGLTNVSAEVSSGDRPVFVAINPCRVTDTRPTQGIGGRTTPIAEKESYAIDVRPTSGDCSGQIPSDALSVQLNVTALNATEQTFLTFHPTGSPQPTASALNPAPATPPVVNAVTTGISSGGEFTVYNDLGTVDLLIDMGGYYVNHNHDDDRPTRIAIGHSEFEGVFAPPDGRVAGTGFIGAAAGQCMMAHIPLTKDMSITAIDFSGYALGGVTVDVGLVRVRHAPGTGLSLADLEAIIANDSFAGGGLGTIVLGTVTPATPLVPDLDTYSYYATTCSNDAHVITGAAAHVSYS